MSTHWNKFLFFQCFLFLLAVNSQQENVKSEEKDDGRIWVELEMEEEPSTSTAAPPETSTEPGKGPSRAANDVLNCGRKKCREKADKECRLIECQLPFEENDLTDPGQSKAWLQPIPFKRGVDPRDCKWAQDPTEVVLEFEFCFRSEFGLPNTIECKDSGYLLCYESHLDPAHTKPRYGSLFSLNNSEVNNLLAELCSEKTPPKNMAKSVMAPGLANWENKKGMGPKHGFLVSQLGIDYFKFSASFDNMSYASLTSETSTICLRITLFPPDSPMLTDLTLVDGNGEKIDDENQKGFARERPNNSELSERLANAEGLEGDLRGYWLLGMDMFAHFSKQQMYNMKIVKIGKDSCVPKGVMRSTLFSPNLVPKKPKPTASAANGDAHSPEIPEDNDQWELATPENVGAKFGGRVRFDDNRVMVDFGSGEDWLNLTFAVPSADFFQLAQPMVATMTTVEEQKENGDDGGEEEDEEEEEDDDGKQYEEERNCWMGSNASSEYWPANALVFQYNQLGADCQILLGRTELMSHLEMPSSNINAEILNLDTNLLVNLRIYRSTLTYYGPKKNDGPKSFPVKLECAVKNVPISEFSGLLFGSTQPFIFQINFLPFSLTKFESPYCKDALQIIFDSQYELLVKKEN